MVAMYFSTPWFGGRGAACVLVWPPSGQLLSFCAVLQLHARALMPQGNWLKGLQTKWRLFQAVLRAGSQPDKAAQTEQSIMDEVGDLTELSRASRGLDTLWLPLPAASTAALHLHSNMSRVE